MELRPTDKERDFLLNTPWLHAFLRYDSFQAQSKF